MTLSRRELVRGVVATITTPTIGGGSTMTFSPALAADPVDAFFANVNWEEVNARTERALRLGAIVRA